MTEPSTPLMRQYAAIKKEHPSALLFFRLGDFYELFFDDAVLAAKELQITLTSRNKEKGIAIPMCGVPHHAAEGYISKLIRKGFKVAICEQVEDPRVAKKLVRREVTRVVTPGTAADSSLSSEENNFLAAVAQTGERAGFAALDLSTGEFRATEFQGEDAAKRIQEEIQQLRPKEVLYASSAPLFEGSHCSAGALAREISIASGYAETPLDDWIFAPDHSIPLLENHFGVLSLEGFGLSGKPAAAAAAGAILYYVRSTQRGNSSHVDRIGFYERQTCLVLDAVTVRNLELIEPLFAGADAGVTLFRSVDATVTPMGKRLLRSWLLRPSIDIAEINARLDAVEVSSKRNHRPRRTAPRARWHPRPGTPAQPGHARNRQPARCPGPGRFPGEAASSPQSLGTRWRQMHMWPRPTRPRRHCQSPRSMEGSRTASPSCTPRSTNSPTSASASKIPSSRNRPRSARPGRHRPAQHRRGPQRSRRRPRRRPRRRTSGRRRRRRVVPAVQRARERTRRRPAAPQPAGDPATGHAQPQTHPDGVGQPG